MAVDYQLLPLTPGDAAAVARVITDYLREVEKTEFQDEDRVRHRMQPPGGDLARDSLAAVVGGEIVGFNVFLHAEEPRLWGMVAGAYRRRGIGTALMSWGIGRARSQPGLTSVYVGTSARRTEAHDLYTRLGFVPVRTFHQMSHFEPGLLTQPDWPPGVTWRNDLSAEEEVRTATEVNNRAFVDHWDYHPLSAEAMAHQLSEPGTGPGLNLFAYLDGEPVALSICVLNGAVGFVGLLGTDPRARGRGVAFALLRQSMLELARRGALRVDLDVDADNPTGAVRLYERSGMTMQSAYSLFRLEVG